MPIVPISLPRPDGGGPVGLSISPEGGFARIAAVVSGGTAQRAGLIPGDVPLTKLAAKDGDDGSPPDTGGVAEEGRNRSLFSRDDFVRRIEDSEAEGGGGGDRDTAKETVFHFDVLRSDRIHDVFSRLKRDENAWEALRRAEAAGELLSAAEIAAVGAAPARDAPTEAVGAKGVNLNSTPEAPASEKRGENGVTENDAAEEANDPEMSGPEERESKRSKTGPSAPGAAAKAAPFPPLPAKSDVRTDTYHQICVSCIESFTLTGSKSKSKSEKDQVRSTYGGGVSAQRHLILKSSASLFDLLKAILCAFGLESDEAVCKPYPSQKNGGKLEIPMGFVFVRDCVMGKDGSLDEKVRIPGLSYRPKIIGRYYEGTNPIAALKGVAIAQALDRPEASTGAARPGGMRQSLMVEIGTPERLAFVSGQTGGPAVPMGMCNYGFFVKVETIGAKKAFRSKFQSLLGARCIGAVGGVEGGSRIDFDYGEDDASGDGGMLIDELNLRFAAGKRMVGLIGGGTGDPEDDFYAVSKWMRQPMFDLYERKDGTLYAERAALKLRFL